VEHPSRLVSSETDLFYMGLESTYGPFTLWCYAHVGNSALA